MGMRGSPNCATAISKAVCFSATWGREPGSNAIWRDRCIEHARARFGIAFVKDLNDYLRQEGLSDGKRIGALRLAGAHWRQESRQTPSGTVGKRIKSGCREWMNIFGLSLIVLESAQKRFLPRFVTLGPHSPTHEKRGFRVHRAMQ